MECYKSTEVCPSFGEGQCKGLSPSNWLFTCSTLLNALTVLVSGLVMMSVCCKYRAERVADTYVDNADNTYINEEENKDEMPQAIQEGIRKIAQT